MPFSSPTDGTQATTSTPSRAVFTISADGCAPLHCKLVAILLLFGSMAWGRRRHRRRWWRPVAGNHGAPIDASAGGVSFLGRLDGVLLSTEQRRERRLCTFLPAMARGELAGEGGGGGELGGWRERGGEEDGARRRVRLQGAEGLGLIGRSADRERESCALLSAPEPPSTEF